MEKGIKGVNKSLPEADIITNKRYFSQKCLQDKGVLFQPEGNRARAAARNAAWKPAEGKK